MWQHLLLSLLFPNIQKHKLWQQRTPSLLSLESLCAWHPAQQGLRARRVTTFHLAAYSKVRICPRIEYVTLLSFLGRVSSCGGKIPFVFPPKLFCHRSIQPYHVCSLPLTPPFGSYQRSAIITPEYKVAIPIFRPELWMDKGLVRKRCLETKAG